MALTLSVLAHLLALSGVPWSSAPTLAINFPIEARLVAAPVAVAAIPSPVPPRRAPTPVIAAPAPAEEVMAAAQDAAQTALPEQEAKDTAEEATRDAANVAEEAAAPPEPAPEAAPEARDFAMPTLRALPAQVVLRYAVQTSEGGFTLGHSTITWTLNDDHYLLESVTEASGITALLVSGRIAQRSEGRVTDTGLRPERFTMERGKRSPQNAEFDWARARLRLRGGEVELPALAQDVLGFPFHLALVLRGDEAPWRLAVTDGRKLREYAFLVVERALSPRLERHPDAVHLRGSREGDGSIDVWLAPSRHWLPVRIRTLDDKGRAMVLSLETEGPE